MIFQTLVQGLPVGVAIVADGRKDVKAWLSGETKKGDQIGLPDPLYAVYSTKRFYKLFALKNPVAKRFVREASCINRHNLHDTRRNTCECD